MTKLNELAKAYTPQQTRNIAELERIPVDLDISTEVKQGKEGEYTQYVAEIEGQRYRVPTSVIKGLKALITKLPSLRYITVIKTGEGMETSYQVIPMMHDVVA